MHEAARDGTAGAEEALTALCRKYWRPLFGFARQRGYSEADAQDLTQAFLALLLEKRALASADPGRGRFRTFLLCSFVHFMQRQRASSDTAKRGGRETVEDWDDEKSAEILSGHRPRAVTDEGFDRCWAQHVLGLALDRMQREFKDAGQAEWFERLRVFLGSPGDGAKYAAVAAEFGLSPDSVNVALHRLRRRLRELVRAEVRRTLQDPRDLQDEFRYLVELLAH